MRIGQLARQAGLRTSAIRYYESLGILKAPARVSGRREYGASALDTLRLVQAAQCAGFTLEETRQLMAVLQNEAATRTWQTMAARKLVELDATIARMRKARRVLADAIDCACAGRVDACKLVANAAVERAPVGRGRARKNVSRPGALD